MQSDPPLDAAPLSACRSVCRSVCKRGCGCRPREWVKGRGGGRGRHTLGGVVTTDGLARVRLPDGRRLDVWQGGDPDGTPVVFFHGTPGGRLQGALGDGAARRVGVRLVAYSRPGYGGSTDARSTLASVAADAGCLADQLALTRFATLGVSGGGPFAIATAATQPDRVTAVGVVAGIGPLLELDPDLRAQPAVRASLAGAHEEALALQDAALTRAASPTTRPRVGTLESPEVLEPWMPSGRPGLPTYRGVSRDAVAHATGWDVDLAAVRAPVWLWYGDRDRSVGLDHARWLHEHLPTSRLVVREGDGHLATLMTHWTEILSAIAEPAR
jgi:pimeloyl-ACP methyl ester carboxylesterase